MQLKPLFILLFNITIANAQQIHLTGSIVDHATHKSIANASIHLINKNLFYPADDAGKFDITNDLAITDSVGFSCIGYQTKKLIVKDLLADGIIQLTPMIAALNEVKIGYKPPQLIKTGSAKRSAFAAASFFPGMQIATFMAGSEKIGGTIKTVGFYLSNGNLFSGVKGDVKTPFRIRLYEPAADGSPGRELTKDVIIVTAQKSGAWFDVDMSAYKIASPDKGFFVSFGLLNDEYYKHVSAKKRNTRFMASSADIITPHLGITDKEFKEHLSYGSYDNGFGIQWHKHGHTNYLIRAVVAVD